MANTKSAIKRAKVAEKRRIRNTANKSEIKTAVKKFEALLEANDKEEAKTQYEKIVSLLDRARYKGVLHQNKVSRDKSRLAKKLNEIVS